MDLAFRQSCQEREERLLFADQSEGGISFQSKIEKQEG